MLLNPTRFFPAAAALLTFSFSSAVCAQTTSSVVSAAPPPATQVQTAPASGRAPQQPLKREYPTTTATALAASLGTSVTLARHPSGMVMEIVRPGTGTELTTGATALIHYVLTSDRGDLWDNSRIRPVPRPFKFESMTGAVVQGMHLGTFGMRVGERRILHVPPELGYGKQQAGGIPPNSWLHFDLELVDVKQPEETKPASSESVTTATELLK